MIAWVVIIIMFAATVVSLAYPLFRPLASASSSDLESLVERAVQEKRLRRPAVPAATLGVAFCPKCQAATRPGDHYCRQCGTKLPAYRCAACGNPYDAGDRFCVRCGAPLDAGGLS